MCTTRPIKPAVKYQSVTQLARSIIGFGVCAVIYTPVLEESDTAFSINMQNLLRQADLRDPHIYDIKIKHFKTSKAFTANIKQIDRNNRYIAQIYST